MAAASFAFAIAAAVLAAAFSPPPPWPGAFNTVWSVMPMNPICVRNIGVSVHFIALHTMSAYRKRFGYKPEDYPKAYAFSESEISLPMYSTLGVKNAEYVADAVLDVVKKYKR